LDGARLLATLRSRPEVQDDLSEVFSVAAAPAPPAIS